MGLDGCGSQVRRREKLSRPFFLVSLRASEETRVRGCSGNGIRVKCLASDNAIHFLDKMIELLAYSFPFNDSPGSHSFCDINIFFFLAR